jgi:hypothetical protein
MSRKSEDTVRERLTVLETEWPHLVADLHAVRKQLELLGRYFRAAVLLGSAAMIHLSGDRFGDISVDLVKFLLKVLLA